MAGTNPNFDAGAFRDGIHFAMTMGAAPLAENRLTFRFPTELVYVGTADAEDVPFDAETTVQRSEPPAVEVPCAVEYYDDQGTLLLSGTAQAARVKITLLDEDYEQVKTADRVMAGGDVYYYRRTEPPSGLFDVGLFVMHFEARSET